MIALFKETCCGCNLFSGHGLWLKQFKHAVFLVDEDMPPALAGFYVFWTMIIVLQVSWSNCIFFMFPPYQTKCLTKINRLIVDEAHAFLSTLFLCAMSLNNVMSLTGDDSHLSLCVYWDCEAGSDLLHSKWSWPLQWACRLQNPVPCAKHHWEPRSDPVLVLW